MPILRRLKNFIIIHGMNFLSLFSRIKKETVVSHLAENQKTWGKYASGLKYIEKQSELSNLFYGQECSRYSLKIANGTPLTAAFNACEIIAIQNALIALQRLFRDSPQGRKEIPQGTSGNHTDSRRIKRKYRFYPGTNSFLSKWKENHIRNPYHLHN